MRIAKTDSVQGPRKKRALSRSGSAHGFASHLDSATETSDAAPSTALSSLSPLGSLLALQDDNFTDPGPKTEYERGQITLDRLDDLRLQLLEGKPDRKLLHDIADMAENRRDEQVSPELRRVLNEIETRAAVEIAKLER